MTKITTGKSNSSLQKVNPLYATTNMRDYHVRGPLGSGFYFTDFDESDEPEVVVPDPGYTYLTENAKQFFDFTQMSGVEDDVIATVTDLSPNGRGLEGVGSPVIKNKQIDGITYKTAETYTDANPTRRYLRFIDDLFAEGMFRSSFEIFLTFMLEDGLPATVSSNDYFGVVTNASNRNIVRATMTYSAPDYFLSGVYTQDTPQVSSYAWTTTNGMPFIDGPMGQTLLRFKYDFENDIFLMSVNGVTAILTTFSNISNITTPNTWDSNGRKFTLGLIDNNGTLSSTTLRMNWLRWAVTPILTTQQAIDVQNYLLL